jgi:hypothetical protein
MLSTPSSGDLDPVVGAKAIQVPVLQIILYRKNRLPVGAYRLSGKVVLFDVQGADKVVALL